MSPKFSPADWECKFGCLFRIHKNTLQKKHLNYTKTLILNQKKSRHGIFRSEIPSAIQSLA